MKSEDTTIKWARVSPSQKQLQMLVGEAFYSGERFMLQGEGGAIAAIVPIEDLEILEQDSRL